MVDIVFNVAFNVAGLMVKTAVEAAVNRNVKKVISLSEKQKCDTAAVNHLIGISRYNSQSRTGSRMARFEFGIESKLNKVSSQINKLSELVQFSDFKTSLDYVDDAGRALKSGNFDLFKTDIIKAYDLARKARPKISNNFTYILGVYSILVFCGFCKFSNFGQDFVSGLEHIYDTLATMRQEPIIRRQLKKMNKKASYSTGKGKNVFANCINWSLKVRQMIKSFVNFYEQADDEDDAKSNMNAATANQMDVMKGLFSVRKPHNDFESQARASKILDYRNWAPNVFSGEVFGRPADGANLKEEQLAGVGLADMISKIGTGAELCINLEDLADEVISIRKTEDPKKPFELCGLLKVNDKKYVSRLQNAVISGQTMNALNWESGKDGMEIELFFLFQAHIEKTLANIKTAVLDDEFKLQEQENYQELTLKTQEDKFESGLRAQEDTKEAQSQRGEDLEEGGHLEKENAEIEKKKQKSAKKLKKARASITKKQTKRNLFRNKHRDKRLQALNKVRDKRQDALNKARDKRLQVLTKARAKRKKANDKVLKKCAYTIPLEIHEVLSSIHTVFNVVSPTLTTRTILMSPHCGVRYAKLASNLDEQLTIDGAARNGSSHGEIDLCRIGDFLNVLSFRQVNSFSWAALKTVQLGPSVSYPVATQPCAMAQPNQYLEFDVNDINMLIGLLHHVCPALSHLSMNYIRGNIVQDANVYLHFLPSRLQYLQIYNWDMVTEPTAEQKTNNEIAQQVPLSFVWSPNNENRMVELNDMVINIPGSTVVDVNNLQTVLVNMVGGCCPKLNSLHFHCNPAILQSTFSSIAGSFQTNYGQHLLKVENINRPVAQNNGNSNSQPVYVTPFPV